MKPPPKLIYYGIQAKTPLKVRLWISSDLDSFPSQMLAMGRIVGTQKESETAAHALRDQWQAQRRLKGTVQPKPIFSQTAAGHVVHHVDAGRVHKALCIGEVDTGCLLLFLTSHPTWNPMSRPITEDEAALAGHTYNDRTYLAPVIRPRSEISLTPASLPTHRIDRWRSEFFSDLGKVWAF